MLHDHFLEPGDYIVYIDSNDSENFSFSSNTHLLTLNKTYKIIKTNYVSSTTIGLKIKADDNVLREFNFYNKMGIPRFKKLKLKDIRNIRLKELGI